MTEFIIVSKKNEDQSLRRIILSKERIVSIQENVDLTCNVLYVNKYSREGELEIELFNITNTLDTVLLSLNS